MDIDQATEERPIAGYRLLAEYLTAQGYPISRSSLAKYCSPAIATGPQIEAYWGRLPTFKPSCALAWARSRLRPAEAGRGRQVGESSAA